MAKINCNGDCLNCEHRINGETHPSECASMFGFVHTQMAVKEMREMHADMKNMHNDIMTAIQGISANEVDGTPTEPNIFECETPALANVSETAPIL